MSVTNYAIETRGRRKEIRIYACNLMNPKVSETEVVNVTLNSPVEVQTDISLLCGGWDAGRIRRSHGPGGPFGGSFFLSGLI